MRNRLLSIYLAIAALLAPVASGAETLWASGVNAEKGWYDFNKVRGRSEAYLCWAITAANMVAWWQRQQAELPEGVPTGAGVWATYRAAFNNDGSDPDQGIRWWFTGSYAPNRPANGLTCARVRDASLGAYYKERGEAFLQSILYRDRRPAMPAAEVMRALREGFRRGDAFWVGVSYLRRDGSRHTHSLNLWGVDVETAASGEPMVVAVYMTDSDDGARVLHRIPLRISGGRLLFDCPTHPLYGRIGDITINNYTALRVAPEAR
ncbi:MAG: IdeS/Mac family cysteine endopeptidase [Akkermansia sp.]|nr:IdeS/Mac family cysteine endopeptidase [Akkermansia sp.]